VQLKSKPKNKMTTNTFRKIDKIVPAKPNSIGTGLKTYDIGQQNLGTAIQPYLQLAHYYMTQPTFAEHPHKGFSAVTYMFEDSEGSFLNEDNQGDRSTIYPGDLHWTQAGSGIRHNETPTEPGRICHGMQMFIDLPIVDKSLPGKAFHLSAAEIPVYETATGARVRVIVGSANGVTSPLDITTKIGFFDAILPANIFIEHEVAAHESAFILVIKGSGYSGDDKQTFQIHDSVMFDNDGDKLSIQAGAEGLQYILCIGQLK
jgi:redox-sensitive bicupin YhaK (pirin superfamily)